MATRTTTPSPCLYELCDGSGSIDEGYHDEIGEKVCLCLLDEAEDSDPAAS